MNVRLFLVVFLSACTDVPDNPTWFDNVQEIVNANCVRCHSSPAANGAPNNFRLDRYVQMDEETLDAWDLRDRIIARAVHSPKAPMPPGPGLSDRQKDILERWLDQGAPKGERTNHTPQVERIVPEANTVTADQELALTFRVWDEDKDGLITQIGIRPKGQESFTLVPGTWASGVIDTVLDTGQLANQSHFEVVAVLDDGFSDIPAENQTVVPLVTDLFIDHGDRGTAPNVVLVAPNGGDTLLGPTEIVWNASDPDPNDVLTIAIDLLRLDASGATSTETSLASGLPNEPSSYSWDPSTVDAKDETGATISYKIRITASDAGNKNTRSDESDAPFRVAPKGGNTSLTWADVKPIFVTYCSECHGQPARSQAIEYFRLDKYDSKDTEAPTSDDQGVADVASLVYERLLVKKNMPPATKPKPTQTELDNIEEWLLAGAPFGEAIDAPPSFSWSTPNDNPTITLATSTTDIQWTASDPEGLPLTGFISMAQLPDSNPPPNPQTARCDANLTNWVEVVASANIEDGTFSVTLPDRGFFCFRGTVTDAAEQTVSVVAGRPIQ